MPVVGAVPLHHSPADQRTVRAKHDAAGSPQAQAGPRTGHDGLVGLRRHLVRPLHLLKYFLRPRAAPGHPAPRPGAHRPIRFHPLQLMQEVLITTMLQVLMHLLYKHKE